MERERAVMVARELAARMGPSCERIHVAGSVRRREPHVKDLEIVHIPKVEIVQAALFYDLDRKRSLVDAAIEQLVKDGVLKWDKRVKRNGPKYKRLIHAASELVVELFAAQPENWGLILALRTGPYDFNRRLVTCRRFGGAMPNDMRMDDGFLWRDRERLVTPSEEAFFGEMGLPVIPPRERSVETLERTLAAAFPMPMQEGR
jgi:DNA polymerase/3'-5' exonuclease PolX